MPMTPAGDHISSGSLSAATGMLAISNDVPASADGVWIEAKTATVTYTYDGTTDPSATVGFTLPLNEPKLLILSVPDLKNLRFLSATGTVNLQFVKGV